MPRTIRYKGRRIDIERSESTKGGFIPDSWSYYVNAVFISQEPTKKKAISEAKKYVNQSIKRYGK